MMEKNELFATIDPEDSMEDQVANDTQHEKYLLFVSGPLLFGVAAEYVMEIINNHTITMLPLVPDYIRGIINLRGQIIPIVDIRHVLGQPLQENSCIIILRIDGTMVGILVDTVQKMIDVDKETILPAPAKDTQNLVCGMCSLAEGTTMLVFDCNQVLNQP